MIQDINPSAQVFLANVSSLTNQINQLTNEASSGLKISQPSDDPGDMVTLQQLRSEIDSNQQVTNNMAPVLSNTQAAEQALQTAVNLVSQATNLATQGSNSLTSATQDQALAQQVGNILQQLVGLANSQANGKFIFSGDQSQSPSYTLNTSSPTGVTALLSNPTATQQIADSNGTTFPVSLTAQQIFDDQSGGVGFAGNAVRLDNAATSFLTGGTQTYTFNYTDNSDNAQSRSVVLTGGVSGINGTTVINQLNAGLNGTGITASINASNGTVQFSSEGAFTAGVAAPTAGISTVTAAANAVNTSQYNVQSAAFSGAGNTLSGADTFTLSDGKNTADVSLASGATVAGAVSTINATLQAAGITGVSALATGDGTGISLQGASTFSVVDTSAAAGGPSPLFTTAGSVAVAAANNGGSAAPDNVFNAVNSLLLGLQNNNQAAITNSINLLQLAGTHLNTQLAFYGSVQNRVQDAQTLASQQNVQLQTQLSQTQDADITQVAVQLTQDQTNLQAAMTAEGQLPKTSLFNFLA
jgi:flagellar hook-associated protein 3 FlgL